MVEIGRALRVLVVDDERTIANTLARILSASGFEARAVYSGEIALETAREMKPDVLITDVIMTGMTGIEAAIRISELVPDCRIILFSGQASTADLLACAEARGHHFEILTKPVHPQILLERLAAIA
jgi:CheY-like chemotaxis protein